MEQRKTSGVEKDESVTHCIVIARNGYGDVWRFFDLKAARLHPIPQMDDVYASSSDQLVAQYGWHQIDDLLRFAEGRDRARLVDAFEIWKGSESTLPVPIRELLWEKVYGISAVPPTDPGEIVRIIKEDRAFREGRILRSIGADERSSPVKSLPPSTQRKREMVERKRIDENSVITVNTEEGKNPKREGSAAFDRFALYRDGMTVKEAKEAGVTASDIAYDSDEARSYIILTPGEAPAEAEATEETAEAAEAKSAKKSRKAA